MSNDFKELALLVFAITATSLITNGISAYKKTQDVKAVTEAIYAGVDPLKAACLFGFTEQELCTAQNILAKD